LRPNLSFILFIRTHRRFLPAPKTTVGAPRCFGTPPQSSVNHSPRRTEVPVGSGIRERPCRRKPLGGFQEES
jgi:hypothetical protein